MRYILVTLLLLTGAFCERALAQSAPFVRTVSTHLLMASNGQVDYKVQCPIGYIPIEYSLATQYPYDINTEMSRALIDRNGVEMSRNALSSPAQLDGAGYAVSLLNQEHHVHNAEAVATCLSAAATMDNTLMLSKGTSTTSSSSTGGATSFCPAEFPVALGGFSNADGVGLQDATSAPLWGTSANPVSLGDVADGQTGPPTGWQVKVVNNLLVTAGIASYAVCGKAPSVQTFVYSVSVPPAVFRTPTPYTIFAPIPDGWTALGSGYDGGRYGTYVGSDAWLQDGIVVDMLQWYASSNTYDSGNAEVRAVVTRGLGSTPPGGTGRAVTAVIATPKAAPAPSSVTIVEFYNVELDHYFITAIPQEIADLDSGVHAGWMRTGQTFKAYGMGSSGRPSRRPVCRAYGRPEAGLDTHFYSASPDECAATLVNGYGFSWGLEASEVFEMDLPDAASGACPPGGVPVYRVWNQRADSNHRYTTSIAIRDQMVQKGGVAEGYGPNAIALCGLP